MNQSFNELRSQRLLGRWGLRDTSVTGGRTIEGLWEGTVGNGIARGILGVVETRGEVDTR